MPDIDIDFYDRTAVLEKLKHVRASRLEKNEMKPHNTGVEPLWDLLKEEDFVNLLFHVNGHVEILRQMNPRTVEELAAVLAVIRPAKRYLLGRTMQEVLKEVWIKPNDGSYYFKKAHGIAYAVAVVVHMNLLCEQAELL